MPSAEKINQHSKRDKLVSPGTLMQAADRIFDWWDRAYLTDELTGFNLKERFANEARVSLPLSAERDLSPAEIMEGILIKRTALKRDLQLPDWNF